MLQCTTKDEFIIFNFIGQPASGYVGRDNLCVFDWLKKFWDSRSLRGVDMIAVQPEYNGYQDIIAVIVDNNGEFFDAHTWKIKYDPSLLDALFGEMAEDMEWDGKEAIHRLFRFV